MSYVEDRLQAFETALGRLFPGGDLDTTLHSLLQDQRPQPKPGPSSRPQRPSAVKHEDDEAEASPEALPQQADGFDWAEKEITLGNLTDGMAALSIKPEGTGYFGMCS